MTYSYWVSNYPDKLLLFSVSGVRNIYPNSRLSVVTRARRTSDRGVGTVGLHEIGTRLVGVLARDLLENRNEFCWRIGTSFVGELARVLLENQNEICWRIDTRIVGDCTRIVMLLWPFLEHHALLFEEIYIKGCFHKNCRPGHSV